MDLYLSPQEKFQTYTLTANTPGEDGGLTAVVGFDSMRATLPEGMDALVNNFAAAVRDLLGCENYQVTRADVAQTAVAPPA